MPFTSLAEEEKESWRLNQFHFQEAKALRAGRLRYPVALAERRLDLLVVALLRLAEAQRFRRKRIPPTFASLPGGSPRIRVAAAQLSALRLGSTT
jgi:hypothetical protein